MLDISCGFFENKNDRPGKKAHNTVLTRDAKSFVRCPGLPFTD